ncbi:response regulator receiver modulated diguanylate cyclase [Alkalidesulfovibrio alkalitolerans DSM 16529]|uniref:diguanylate cyclase n=1 Tax=Alkalidesulfovibrio alkalitolerans DSM 16529 TaxID=1121439 RepID=S7UCP1_9BACT|nr:diguanylate cyclase [Alkalidesulfovibrio alkalitolerans]EPR31629.1 response regulator receiver modulated diguanylate cyclase [Alkalidesulfovibrio alkalitolerans DSM 16529]
MMTPAACKFQRRQRVFCISSDAGLRILLQSLWSSGDMEWVFFERGRSAIETLFNEPPDLLIVDKDLPDLSGLEVAALVKSENVYRQLPVIVCLKPEDLAQGVDFGRIECDDFLVAPYQADDVRGRVCLTLSRAMRGMDANPLTKLPGNTSIIQRIQELIDRQEDFALAYVDLDYFKSFNDKYGFSRGDEVLLMAARVIVNTIRGFAQAKTFVGHVGGDDFVFITPPGVVEEACKRIIKSFDDIVPLFYDNDDRAQGFIRSTDRQGQVRDFPLMAVSIAVVFNLDGRLKHFGEASAIAGALKKKAKENPKSCYVLDRREGSPDINGCSGTDGK